MTTRDDVAAAIIEQFGIDNDAILAEYDAPAVIDTAIVGKAWSADVMFSTYPLIGTVSGFISRDDTIHVLNVADMNDDTTRWE